MKRKPYLASRNQLNQPQLLQRLHLKGSRVVAWARHTYLEEIFCFFPLLKRSEGDTSGVMISQVIGVV